MLTILKVQLEAFAGAAAAGFDDGMVEHVRKFSPRLSRVLGVEGIRVAVRQGIRAASTYGFTRRGPVRFYIDLMLLLGSGVANDPQYPWAGALLRAGDESDQLARAGLLHGELTRYLERVHGLGNTHVYSALRRLARAGPGVSEAFSGETESELLAFLEVIHPEKYAHTEREALVGLIRGAIRRTRYHTGRCDRGDAALMTALSFCFGHACDVDPLYPWIGRTLAREPRAGRPDRMRVLERQALAWLAAVLRGEGQEIDDESA